MDLLCFVDHFNVLASVIQNLQTNVQHLQHTVNDIRRNQQTNRILDDFMLENFHKLVKSVKRIENRVCGEQSRASQSNPTSEDGAIKFSMSSEFPATEDGSSGPGRPKAEEKED